MTDPAAVAVADASAVINLNATGCAREIVAALPNRVVVVDIVPEELERGRERDRKDADLLHGLVAAGAIEIVRLDETALGYFEGFVVGSAADTLDDGEAATIAYALAEGTIPLIDERKATRLCAERHPALRVGCTVDLFAHPRCCNALAESRWRTPCSTPSFAGACASFRTISNGSWNSSAPSGRRVAPACPLRFVYQ